MRQLGYQAVNVGERDIKMGYEQFAKWTSASKLKFVSANILRQDNQEPVFAPHTIVDTVSPDGTRKYRVGVIGIARFNPLFLKAGPDGSNMVIAHPTDIVKREVAALKAKKVDTIVLLAALHKDDARRIVRDAPGIGFVIGSYGGAFTNNAEQEADTYILYSGNQGKRFGETRVFLSPAQEVQAQVTKMHFLTAVYPSNPEMAAFVDKVPLSAGAAPGTADYVGSAACKDCHEDAYRQWSGTGHAKALATLEASSKQADAGCIGCHVTGAGTPTGFRDLATTPELAGVGCESCHGPGSIHLENPFEAYGGRFEVAACTGCHDVKNSPEFDYYGYLPRVTHGARATR